MISQPSPFDSMREAVFTVSPNRQYLGIACPTTPVYTAYGATITVAHFCTFCTTEK